MIQAILITELSENIFQQKINDTIEHMKRDKKEFHKAYFSTTCPAGACFEDNAIMVTRYSALLFFFG